ncbi:MAG TPA: cytochrome c biogenesis protein DipZ [Sphingomicrobium sp.]|nr:cytochrome c biogenesis protein DipZ [Sphingomicrobium sp.]
MLIALLAFLGGMLTIVSPCILPVLPFVFARAGKPFVTSTLPLLAGMALTFSLVASLAAVGGAWAVRTNEIGRVVALILLALFGIALIFPAVSDRLTRPLVAWGAKLSETAGKAKRFGDTGSSLLLGAATGLLWAPCAGPILGIIFTTAALNGANASTTLLLLSYAAGAATSLAIAMLAGKQVFNRMKGSLGASEAVRKGLGVAVLLGVGAIALGFDTRILARLSSAQTATIETGLARKLGIGSGASSKADFSAPLPIEGLLPALDGLGPWINSPPLTREQLRGKVVLIDFWTYSCINCIRSIPYVKAWHERYARDGLVVIGVHAPEFAFERNPANVRKAVAELGISYPVALDNQYKVWRALKNNYWPAHYFIDAQGRVRFHHYGEGSYDNSEKVIRALLMESGRRPAALGGEVKVDGAAAAAARASLRSPETYLGYGRDDRFVSPGGLAEEKVKTYRLADTALNDWAYGGPWKAERERSVAQAPGTRIRMRFHARDLHMVLASTTGRPIRFRVTLDGKAPGRDAGLNIAPDGSGTIRDEGFYQLIRQKGAVSERSFEIEFLDRGAAAFTFTFG